MKKFLNILKWLAIIFIIMSVMFAVISFGSKLVYDQWEASHPDQVNPAGRIPSTR
jgi:hypothetical protein